MSSSQQLTIEQAISQAEKAARQGNVAVARQLYNAILRHQSNHPIAIQGLRKLQQELPYHQLLPAQMADPSPDQINTLINLYHSGPTTKTEQACRELLHTHPQSLTVLNVLGAVLAGQGQLQKAVQVFDQISQLQPDYAEAHNNRGVALKELKQLDESMASYRRAIQIRPDYAEAYYNRGPTLTDLGRQEEAVMSYNSAIQLKPDYAEAYYNRGNALQELGRLREAVEDYQKAISIDPQNGLFWAGYAECLQSMKPISCGNDLVHDLLQMLEQLTVSPHGLSKTVISALRYSPKFLRILELFKSNHADEDIDH